VKIIKEATTCTKCKHNFTFEYPEKHDEIKIKCPNCSAEATLPKTKGKAGLVVKVIIGVIVIIILIISAWSSCIGGSTIC